MAIQITEIATIKDAMTSDQFLKLLADSKKGKKYLASCLVTPSLASLILDKYNTVNRNISKVTLNKYARNMQKGNWLGFIGDAITFDVNGNLNNGQHRLLAMLESGTPTEALLIFGLTPESRFAEGDGKPKSYFDMLTMTKDEEAMYLKELSSLVRLQYGFLQDQIHPHTKAMNEKPSNAELDAVEQVYGKSLMDSILFTANIGISNVMTLSTAAYAHFLFKHSKHGKKKADEFMESLASGVNLSANDPCLTVRNRFMSNDGVALTDPETGKKSGKTVPWTSQKAKELALGLMQHAWNFKTTGAAWTNKQPNPKTMLKVNGLTSLGGVQLYTNTPSQGTLTV